MPLRAVLAGLYEQHDIAAARRAIAPFYMDAVAEVHLEDGLGARGRLNRIVHSRPQVILVTGGTDGGARTVLLELLAVVRQAVSLITQGSRPIVVFAGNKDLSVSAREMLSQHVEVLISPNVRGRCGHHGARRRPASSGTDLRQEQTRRQELPMGCDDDGFGLPADRPRRRNK